MAWPPTTHQDVENEVGRARAAILSAVVRGQWYTAQGNPVGTANGLTYETLYYVPVWMPAGTVQTLACRNTVAGATGQVVRMGMYGSVATTGFPGALLVDAGTVAATVAGTKEFAVSVAVEPGLYYIAGVIQGASGSSSWRPVTLENTTLGVPVIDPTTVNHAFVHATLVTGALPSSAGTVSTQAAPAMRPWYRMAA